MQTTIHTKARARVATPATLLKLSASALAMLKKPFGDGDDEDGDDGPGGRTIEGLIARYGNAKDAANELWRDNFKMRQERRTLKAENAKLKESQPAVGTVVLTKEEAADWEAFKKLGKPADLEKQITEGMAAAEQVAKSTREQSLAKAAADVGFNPAVLSQLAELHNLKLTSTTVRIGDRDETVHHLTAEGGTPIEVKQYAAANWQAFMPSLQAAPAGTPPAGTPPAGTPPAGTPPGTQWMPNGGTGGAGPAGNTAADIAQRIVQQRTGAPPAATPPAGTPPAGTPGTHAQ